MAGKKVSKNNPSNRSNEPKVKMVTSDVCEKCSTKCAKGKLYLERIKLKGTGNGCPCFK